MPRPFVLVLVLLCASTAYAGDVEDDVPGACTCGAYDVIAETRITVDDSLAAFAFGLRYERTAPTVADLLARDAADLDEPGSVTDRGTDEGVIARRWYLRALGAVSI